MERKNILPLNNKEKMNVIIQQQEWPLVGGLVKLLGSVFATKVIHITNFYSLNLP